jgi:hypothetical protein
MEHIKVIELPHKSAQGATYTLLEKVNEVVTWINEHGALASCCTDAIAPALTVNAPAWISVKDRLPEEGTHVLVCGRPKIGEVPYIVDKIYKGDWMLWGVWNNTSRYIVTHWMPLPAPPEAVCE